MNTALTKLLGEADASRVFLAFLFDLIAANSILIIKRALKNAQNFYKIFIKKIIVGLFNLFVCNLHIYKKKKAGK